MLEASNHDGAAAAQPRRRITADSFRALQARLAGVPFVPREEPVVAEVAPFVAEPRSREATIILEPAPAPPSFAPRVDWVSQPVVRPPAPEPPPVWQAKTIERDEPATNGHPIELPFAEAAAPEPLEEAYQPPEMPPAPPEWSFQAPAQAEETLAPLAEAVEREAEFGVAETPQDWAPQTATQVAEAPAPVAEAIAQPTDFSAAEMPAPVWTPVEEERPAAETEPAVVAMPAPTPVDAMEEARRAFAQIAAETEAPVEVEASEAIEPVQVSEAPPPAAPRRQSIIRRSKPSEDPFAGATSFSAPVEEPAVAVVVEEPDVQAGEVARSLIDIMASTAGSSQPQERALAADTLLRLVPRVPTRELVQIAERVSKMDNPPQLLVSRIIRDPRPEVAASLLERASNIVDQELLAVAAENDPVKLRMIARRRTVSTALSDAIIKSGDASALLTLVRNPGASLSHDAFQTLCEMARETPALHAPLATRADTPPVVAFQMFWLLPAELRRYILSRFLTDSETLNRILKITMAVDGGEDAMEAGDAKFPDAEDVDSFLALAAQGDLDAATRRLSAIAGICEETGRRILADQEGEPLAVLLKSLGLSRTRFGEALERLSQPPAALLRDGRNLTDLQRIFDQLSFNKARVLLTYWDWAAQQTGPYAKRAA